MNIGFSLRILGTALCLILAAPSCIAQRSDPEAAPASAGAPEAEAEAEARGMLGTTSGEQVYTQICQGCHMPQGLGAQGAGNYPALAGNPAVASANYLAITILNGRRNMPAFVRDPARDSFFEAVWLSDEQIANVVNYIRNSFGNSYPDAITPADVRALRPAATDSETAH